VGGTVGVLEEAVSHAAILHKRDTLSNSDLHLIYDYDAHNPETGEPEKWRYEM
jgi:hypothetical protein